MKAIVCTKYGPPEVLQLREVEKPTPKNNEVLIKIYATAVTSSDVNIRGSHLPFSERIPLRLMLGFTRPRNPILGNVLAGEIEAVGNDVKQFRQGDQVYGYTGFRFGAYAEYICLPVNESKIANLAKKPFTMNYEEAAAIPFGGLFAMHYINTANIQRGQKVLVYGASGAIGTAAVQLAKHLGADVTGVCSTKNLELVKSLGAVGVIDYTKKDVVDTDESYDVILDAAGKSKTSKFKLQCKKALAQNGRYMSVDDGIPKLSSKNLVFLQELIDAGHFRAVIDRCYPIVQMVEAHTYVEKGHKKGNVVISVNSDN